MSELGRSNYLTKWLDNNLLDTPLEHPIPKRLELIDYASLTMISLFLLGIINNIANR